MSECTPTTDEVRAVWREWNGYGGLIDRTGPEPTTRAGMVAEFDRWLDQVRAVARREGQTEGMRSTANWLDGGTPRAYGFQHPCDPPHMRTQPTERELRLMYAVDAIREAADRIENGADQ